MSTIKITIKNLSEIRAAFNKSPRLMTKELQTAIEKTAIGISGEAQRNVGGQRGIRVVTGGLKGAVERMVDIQHLKATLFPDIDYAGYVHEGTKFMEGRPYLLNAVDTKQSNTDKYFEQAVDNVLKEIARSA